MGRSGCDPEVRAVILAELDGLYRFVFVRVGCDVHLAEELVQQTVAAALMCDAWPTNDVERARYLRGIARNLTRRHWRNDGRARRARDAGLGRIVLERLESDRPEEAVADEERRFRLLEAVAGLPGADQRILYAFYKHGQSTTQIAAELGLTPKSVEMRLYRARIKLRAQLEGSGEVEA